MTKEEHNELLLDVIVAALKGYTRSKNAGNEQNADPADNELWLEVKGSFSYLLGQAIRQWIIPDENWHISVAAKELWNKLTDEDIDKRGYNESFHCKSSAVGLIVPRFAGTTRQYAKLEELTVQANKSYVFNQIFIAEHTITVTDIRDALEECYTEHKYCECLLKKEMKSILNKMHITQMLKIEDRRILDCQKRIIPEECVATASSRLCIYKFLKNHSSKDVFETIKSNSYCNLPPKILSRARKYKNTIKKIQKQNKEKLPNWAEATELTKTYTINIDN